MFYERYLKFDVMFKDDLCVEVTVDRVNKELTLKNHTKIGFYNPFKMPNPKMSDVIDYIENRCFPETRANAEYLLKELGLKCYDPIDITRVTRGLMMDDHFWIRYEGDDVKYEDIRVRPTFK